MVCDARDRRAAVGVLRVDSLVLSAVCSKYLLLKVGIAHGDHALGRRVLQKVKDHCATARIVLCYLRGMPLAPWPDKAGFKEGNYVGVL